jgi:hypothetical protein
VNDLRMRLLSSTREKPERQAGAPPDNDAPPRFNPPPTHLWQERYRADLMAELMHLERRVQVYRARAPTWTFEPRAKMGGGGVREDGEDSAAIKAACQLWGGAHRVCAAAGPGGHHVE